MMTGSEAGPAGSQAVPAGQPPAVDPARARRDAGAGPAGQPSAADPAQARRDAGAGPAGQPSAVDPARARRDAGAGPGPAAGLLMAVAAVTLGVAAYLHRNGHIPLGFTDIGGESFYGASIPEAVIAFVLAAGAAVYLAAPRAARASAARGQARRVALAATIFAIIGTAYGMTVTISDGRVPDIVYHSSLMATLLIAAALLLRRRPAASRQPE